MFLILLFTFICFNESFIIPFNTLKLNKKLYLKENDMNSDDIESIFNQLNNLESDKEEFPTIPKNEDEIIDDSFDGYLKKEFYSIINYNLNYDEKYITFHDFYFWRKEKIGTLWTYAELKDIFEAITNKDDLCDIINFILINKIIDENDGADF